VNSRDDLIVNAFQHNLRLQQIKHWAKDNPMSQAATIIVREEARLFRKKMRQLKSLGMSEREFFSHINKNHEYYHGQELEHEFMLQCKTYLKFCIEKLKEENVFTPVPCRKKHKCDGLCPLYEKATKEEIRKYDLGEEDPFDD